MPKNTPFAILIAACAFGIGFGFVWHIWWLAILCLLSLITLLIVRSTDEKTEYTITAARVAKIEAGAGGAKS